jgi:processive 1,2-diacylglycerol beta-glucosyltransferase
MSARRKVLFCYITPSSGHQKAAEAMMAALKVLRPDIECEGIHSISYAAPLLGKIVSRLYLQVLKRAPQVWDFIYDNPRVERATRDLRDLLHIFKTAKILRLLREHGPHALVCTQAVPVGLLAALKEHGKLRLPLIGVVTDFGVHAYWLSRHVDLYLVPTEDVRRRMIRSGIAAARVRVTGIPIDPVFAHRGDARAERESLGLSPHRPTVLMMGGHYGLGPLEDAVRALRRLPGDVQVMAVCGSNRSLYKALSADFASDRRVKIFGHTRSIARLMDAADLLVSKPGGLTTAESLAKGLPMMMISPIPGQEERNARFLLRHGAAERVAGAEDLARRVEFLLERPDAMRRRRERTMSLGRPRAAFDAAEAVLELLERRVGDRREPARSVSRS